MRGCGKALGYEKVSDELFDELVCHWTCRRAVALALQPLWVSLRGAASLLVVLDVTVQGYEKAFELHDELSCHWLCRCAAALGLLLLWVPLRRGSLLLAVLGAKVQGYEKVSDEIVADCLVRHWMCQRTVRW